MQSRMIFFSFNRAHLESAELRVELVVSQWKCVMCACVCEKESEMKEWLNARCDLRKHTHT